MKVIAVFARQHHEQAASGPGLAAQRATISHAATLRGWQVTWIEDAGYSARTWTGPASKRRYGCSPTRRRKR